MKVTTVATLKLNPIDKELLIWHLSDRDVLDHKIFKDIPDIDQRTTRWYATRKRIYDETKICIYLPYSLQIKQLAHGLVKTLEFPGEFNPPRHLEPLLFSRASADPAITKLSEITNDVLLRGAVAVPPLPEMPGTMTSNRPERPSQFERGLAAVFYEDDDGEF